MATLGMTHSVCAVCRRIVPAKVLADGQGVHFLKFCPRHGSQKATVRSDVAEYLRSQRYVKPAWRQMESAGDSAAPCPHGCGFCDRHEQHLCMPIVEITQRCNLACPACIASAGGHHDMSLEDFGRILDGLIASERQVDVLNLSGGEPLLHPRIMEIVDEAVGRKEIVRVSVSTNGLPLLDDPSLLRRLHERDVVLSLQMDGFDDRAYEFLRGRGLLAEKQRIMEMLAAQGITTSLTFTAAGGVNDTQLRPVLDYLFGHEHVVSLMIQPLSFAGRGEGLLGRAERLTIPDVVRLLHAAGHPAVRGEDFVPLPCSHPLCFSLAFYLMLDGGGAVSINRLLQAGAVMDSVSNRTVFGLDAQEHERLKEMVYEIWSGPVAAAPDGEQVMRTLSAIMREISGGCGCFDPRKAFHLAERRVKSIFIHAFQDAQTFDLSRVRRCCNAYPQPDGKLIPACVHNVLGGRRT